MYITLRLVCAYNMVESSKIPKSWTLENKNLKRAARMPANIKQVQVKW